MMAQWSVFIALACLVCSLLSHTAEGHRGGGRHCGDDIRGNDDCVSIRIKKPGVYALEYLPLNSGFCGTIARCGEKRQYVCSRTLRDCYDNWTDAHDGSTLSIQRNREVTFHAKAGSKQTLKLTGNGVVKCWGTTYIGFGCSFTEDRPSPQEEAKKHKQEEEAKKHKQEEEAKKHKQEEEAKKRKAEEKEQRRQLGEEVVAMAARPVTDD